MLIQHESPAPAPAAVSGTSQKLLQLLRKRLRQLARVTLVLAICLAVAASAFAIWWLTSLNGLPDIGDPFDVAAFRAFSIPDDQNAFAFLRRANEKVTPIRVGPVRGHTRTIRSSPGRSRIRRCGSGPGRTARRSNCFCRGPTNPTRRTRPEIPQPAWVLGSLDSVAFLEGSRRQESGDTAGAWDCYRAVLRMITHIRRRGSTRSALFRQEGEPLVCSDGSPTGRRIRGPRPPNFIPPWMKCSRTSQTPIGISLQLNMVILISCARSSGQCRFLFSRRSRGNGRLGLATWHFRRP